MVRLDGNLRNKPSWMGLQLLLVVVVGAASMMALRAASGRQTATVGALPTFTDITRQAGITCKIVCGDEESEYLTDVNGEGACFIDYNNDGYQDIYLVNGTSRKLQAAGKSPHDYLLKNNGDGTFTDVTAQAHLGASGLHSGCAVGDYNNDGYPDIFVTNFGPNILYRNNGDGTFTNVTDAAGVAGPHWDFPKWSMGAAFGDYDNDGNLDLYVTNFSKFDPRHPPARPMDAKACLLKNIPIVCPPDTLEGEQAILYHNNGDGTFTDVTRQAGIIRKDPGHGFGVVFGDFNNDGLQDIYQVNDAGPNFYYVNKGDGTFRDASWNSGLAVDVNGKPQGSMGVTVGDYNNDGLLDIFVSNWIEQNETLYENQGSHLFLDQTQVLGIGHVGFEYCAWGTGLFDFDNDGWLDLWITYGHTNEQMARVYPADTFAEPNYLLRNLNGKKFTDVSSAVGLRRFPNHSGRGTAFGDIDNDGDLDVLVINKNDVPSLLRNDGGNTANWLVVRTEGVKSNRSGIGARITVTVGGKNRIFEVRGSESYLSGNDLRVHIGLGDFTQADSLEVRWPSGRRDRSTDVTARRFYLAREGQSLVPDPLIRPGTKTR